MAKLELKPRVSIFGFGSHRDEKIEIKFLSSG